MHEQLDYTRRELIARAGHAWLVPAALAPMTDADDRDPMTSRGEPALVTVRTYGALGNGITDDTTAIQSAIDDVSSKGGGKVYFPPGIYVVKAKIILRQGVMLEGDQIGVRTNIAYHGARLTARASMDALIETGSTQPRQPHGIRNLFIYGNKHRYQVDTLVSVLGRNTVLDNVMVMEGSGIGVHLRSGDASPTWVNWIQGCQIGRNGKCGLWNETSDSFIAFNYFSHNPVNISATTGGNAWIGNHFDLSSVAGLKVQAIPPALSTLPFRRGDRIIGNYFDRNDQGLWVTTEESSQYESHLIIEGNRFRDNRVDIKADRAQGFVVSDCRFTRGARTEAAIAFANVYQGMLNGLVIDRDYPNYFLNMPESVTVRNSMATGTPSALRSERAGHVLMPGGETSVVVQHDLMSRPHVVLVQQYGLAGEAGRQYWVGNVTTESFTIFASTAVTGDKDVAWWATISQ